mgnify:CR=1 FL=1|tara:strand:+ start:340 stop:606 length:267 start_codon:yes stop_codon:yes gene_type:complete
MSDFKRTVEHLKLVQKGVADSEKPKGFNGSILGRMHGEANFEPMYRVGEASPIVQHIRQVQAKAKEEQDAEECANNFMKMFFNFDMED